MNTRQKDPLTSIIFPNKHKICDIKNLFFFLSLDFSLARHKQVTVNSGAVNKDYIEVV
jgi:hypothetical protein